MYEQSRVVEGQDAEPHEYPWMVILVKIHAVKHKWSSVERNKSADNLKEDLKTNLLFVFQLSDLSY